MKKQYAVFGLGSFGESVAIELLKLGCEVVAIDAIMEDQRNVMIGIEHDEIVYVPFSKAIKNDKPIKRDLVTVLKELSI